MRVKEIRCINKKGDSLILSSSTGIYRLQEDLDTSGIKANVTYASNFRIQGSTAVATRLEKRDLQLNFYIDVDGRSEEWIQSKRDEVFSVFNPIYNPIRLEIKTPIRDVFIETNVELAPSIGTDLDSTNDAWHDVLVQLSTGNPYFQDIETRKMEIANWEPLLEFPIELKVEGNELGRRSQSLIVNVINEGQVPTGMVIQFRAIGTLKNPSLLNLKTREYFKLNRIMQAGEVVKINTNQGKKRIESQLNGITANIFNNIVFGSTFMQLDVGDNLFRYDAEDNLSSLEVTIYFVQQYLGV